jgi:hypothetical protein
MRPVTRAALNTPLMERMLTHVKELESECLKPQPSEKLAQIGLALLKHVSSHKGLTYVVRVARAPRVLT